MCNKENLHIWNHANKMDPKFLKPDDSGGRPSFSVNSYWIFMKATELFGPMGEGWGYDIVEDRFDEGADIWHPASLKKDIPISLGKHTTHTIRLKVWYTNKEGKKIVSSDHFGHTTYIYMTHKGIKTDGEAPKKSITDAVKKCLSMLGFAGDVYMGQFDDREYVEALQTEFEIENAEDKDKVTLEKQDELKKDIENILNNITNKAITVHEVAGFKKAALRSLDRQQKIPDLKEIAKRGMMAIDKAASAKKEQLSPSK